MLGLRPRRVCAGGPSAGEGRQDRGPAGRRCALLPGGPVEQPGDDKQGEKEADSWGKKYGEKPYNIIEGHKTSVKNEVQPHRGNHSPPGRCCQNPHLECIWSPFRF